MTDLLATGVDRRGRQPSGWYLPTWLLLEGKERCSITAPSPGVSWQMPTAIMCLLDPGSSTNTEGKKNNKQKTSLDSSTTLFVSCFTKAIYVSDAADLTAGLCATSHLSLQKNRHLVRVQGWLRVLTFKPKR